MWEFSFVCWFKKKNNHVNFKNHSLSSSVVFPCKRIKLFMKRIAILFSSGLKGSCIAWCNKSKSCQTSLVSCFDWVSRQENKGNSLNMVPDIQQDIFQIFLTIVLWVRLEIGHGAIIGRSSPMGFNYCPPMELSSVSFTWREGFHGEPQTSLLLYPCYFRIFLFLQIEEFTILIYQT